MQRVSTPTAVAQKPAYATGGEPGFFTQGDPVQGLPATVPGQDFLNRVQEELCNTISGAGLPLDPADDTQLDQAIDAKIAFAVRLKEDGGLVRTEDGLAVDPNVLDASAQLRYHGLI